MDINKIIQSKGKSKLVMLTAYDFISAKILSEASVDIILVGDSLGNVILGYPNTIPVTMEEMLIHVAAVRRGAPKAFVVADMPFLSYQCGVDKAVENAGSFLKVGANAVKIEGGIEVANIIKKIVDFGIPVMGHLGLTPQYVNQIGGYKVQGGSKKSKEKLLRDAIALQEAGVFSIVLELIVEETSKEITNAVKIPTIGIGSGRFCDGQVIVLHDLLGLIPSFKPKFVKRYANLFEVSKKAVTEFIEDVKNGAFPSDENVFHI
ncbi:MAG TPA: 3-methyl-2-oxobutanoate hydroxymethyltransferase [Thermotogaceae bacterium]|nr:3-methyl-2-oxobutanoate hydroxymethyltransferase [Thermotogaceae bacterium]